MIGDHVTGLMNLSAFATVLSLTYLGLDKFDPTADKFTAAKGRIAGIIAQVYSPEMLRGRGMFSTLNHLDEAAQQELEVLGLVSGEIDQIKYRSISHFIYVQWRVPLYRYFSARRDIGIISILSILSCSSFIAISAATVWALPLIDNHLSAALLFWLYLFTIATIFSHLSALYRYSSIDILAQRLAHALAQRMNERIKDISIPTSPTRERTTQL